MELIQPFINSADAVLAETTKAPIAIGEVSMDEEAYRRRGIAAMVAVNGDIEGRVIFDLESTAATELTRKLMGLDDAPEEMIPEAVCELANQVIGNAVTVLNDQGFNFKVHPPEVHTSAQGAANTEDQEALVMCFDTCNGSVFMNIAMRYNHRRKNDPSSHD